MKVKTSIRTIIYTTALVGVLTFFAAPAHAGLPEKKAKKAVEAYAELVYESYEDSLKSALKLQKAIDAFLENPSEETHKAAKQAWLDARVPYGQTEAFRFYEGPIDFVDEKNGKEGPEGRLNSWPLNEAYVDYVSGNDKAGIINSSTAPITKESITEANQQKDEADVSTGYHAIEFLLWGQDMSKETAGTRSYTDYLPGKENNDRRRAYLKAVTALLVDDLAFLESEWEDDNDDGYGAKFKAMPVKESIGKILTGITTLSGFELASERMSVALKSGDQEDEHSCFSDNTHVDFIENAHGIENVYAVISDVIEEEDEDLDEKIKAQIAETKKRIAAIPHPIDANVLATPEGSDGRKAMLAAIESLQAQTKLFQQAGEKLGVEAKIVE